MVFGLYSISFWLVSIHRWPYTSNSSWLTMFPFSRTAGYDPSVFCLHIQGIDSPSCVPIQMRLSSCTLRQVIEGRRIFCILPWETADKALYSVFQSIDFPACLPLMALTSPNVSQTVCHWLFVQRKSKQLRCWYLPRVCRYGPRKSG